MKTKLKNIIFGLTLAFTLSSALVGCNSKEEILYTLPSSTTVRSFNLSADTKVLPNLDSVFFSIDLYSYEIFNADSLPFGTKVDKLVPVILTESASAVELIVSQANGNDTTYNYLENTNDSIDFTKPVRLRVVSYDGVNESTYKIHVNVHKVQTDTLVWSRMEGGSLPTLFNAVNEQHTTMSPGGVYYCMTSYQGEYAIAYTTDLNASWNVAKSEMSFNPEINSFTAASDALYILDKDGLIYKSTDEGLTWEATGVQAQHIIGAYGSRLLTTNNPAGNWSISEYPSGNSIKAPENFPVRNTSNSTTISFEMSISEQLLITGGKKADGTLTGDTWGFDGKDWAKISRTPLPEKIENLTLVPYFALQTDSISWRVSKSRSVLLAMCGNKADGVNNDTIYISKDFGINWEKAPMRMQVPTTVIPSRTMAQAYPFTGVSYVTKQKRKASFSDFESKYISWQPIDFGYETIEATSMSRASTAITEWDVPYIYLFGGVGNNGATFNTIFRGVITALTFKPLQ